MTQVSVDQAMQVALQHQQAGRLAQAEQIYRQALAAQPDHPQALHLLGILVAQTGRGEAAVEIFSRAIQFRPDASAVIVDLAIVLRNLGRLDESVAAWQRVAALHPNSGDVAFNLGLVLRELGKSDEAIIALQRATVLNPNSAEAHNSLGFVFLESQRLDEAIAAFREAVRLKPEYPKAQLNLGAALRDMGRNDLAVKHYRDAVRAAPENAEAHSGLIFAMNADPACDAGDIFREAKEWARRHERPGPAMPAFGNEPSVDRRLRIGYLTPDFCAHASACFLLPLLANHDAKNVEIFCYSAVKKPDDFTRRFQNLAHRWIEITGWPDEKVIAQIRNDGIDVLVDLNLHAAGTRLPLFAARPAPVQVTWLGYPGTSGITAMGYRLTDPYLDPPGRGDEFYSEKSIRLSDTFWCYDPSLDPGMSIEVNPLPAIGNGFVTFGCLNGFYKVNPDVLELWAKLLGQIAGSRMILMAPAGPPRQRVLDEFAKEGVEAGRIEFVGRQARVDYFKVFNRIDIVLDTFPYTGHTTGLDSVWMGVPFVTLNGATAVGRGGVSILSNLAMTDWIAKDADEYIAIAKKWADDLATLSEIRSNLRRRMENSPLMNGPKFAADMESAYRQMWREWCVKNS